MASIPELQRQVEMVRRRLNRIRFHRMAIISAAHEARALIVGLESTNERVLSAEINLARIEGSLEQVNALAQEAEQELDLWVTWL